MDKLKTSLPAGIISCVADGLGESNVITRNGVIAIDIDASKNPAIYDWQAVKRELAKSPYIAYCGLSVSGLGVWAMIPVANPAKHLEHFRAICKDFERPFRIMQHGETEPTILNGIHLDAAPSNIISKRFVSYDPYPYTNTSARIYERTEAIAQPQRLFFSAICKDFDLEGWLKAHGIEYNARYRQGGVQYIVRCPNASQHSSRHKAESAVFLYPDGKPGYHCFHDHCSHLDWKAYRKIYEPNYGHREPFNIVRLSPSDIHNALISAGFTITQPAPIEANTAKPPIGVSVPGTSLYNQIYNEMEQPQLPDDFFATKTGTPPF